MLRVCSLVFVVVVSLFPLDADAQTAIRSGRIDRTLDVAEFNDFSIYLSNSTTEVSVYAQWSTGSTVIPDDITLLCLYGPDGTIATNEDDDLTLGNSRLTSYKIIPGKLWYTTTVSGQRCWLTLDFRHHEQYDMSATARFTIIMSELDATEETWESASAFETQMMQERAQRAGASRP